MLPNQNYYKPAHVVNDLIDISEPAGEQSAFEYDEEEKVPGER